uniref:Golgin subfamily A conserved domain-containing protein n=1 Tax=Panagrolaimus sp. JU765 TaxID=591449 RepID=A0AC34QQI8_9BILA
MENKDAKLLQAKQLLKKYQSRREENHGSTIANGADGNGTPVKSLNGDAHSDVGSVTSSRASSTMICDQVPMNHFAANEQQEVGFLRKILEEKDKSLKDAHSKLQNLQTHYAELHAAYTSATQNLQNSTPAEYADQISKLQTALSVAIEEKTVYQSDLRTLRTKVQALEADNKDMHAMLKATTGSSSLHETEKRKLREEVDGLALKLKHSTEELEKHRIETTILESKVREVNQDRTDLQTRLKYLFNEKDELEKQLSLARHDLEMKNIAIKQLSYSETPNNDGNDGQQILEILTKEKEKLIAELTTANSTIIELDRQQKASNDYYESFIGELNVKIQNLEENFKEISNEKSDLEATKFSLEEKINYLINQQAENLIPKLSETEAATMMTEKSTNIKMNHQNDPIEIEALRNSVHALQNDCSRAMDRIHELEIIVQEKEQFISHLENNLVLEQHRSEKLRDDIENIKNVNTDVHSLLEQLQNEKATVSRAIAQNIELKEQLGELQDKFVEITNENANLEDQRQTAIATIDKLERKIDEMLNEKKNLINFFEKESQTETEKSETSTTNVEQQTDFTFGQKVIQIKVIAILDEIVRQLETKLESLANEKKEIQIANDKLQYFLTALESENESIGEYIALYRFQRQNIQKKVAEKDALISQLSYERQAAQLQIAELQQVLYNLFGQSPPILTANGTTQNGGINGEEDHVVDKLNKILLEIQQRQHQCATNRTKNDFADPKLHCPECRGQMFTL